VLALAISLLAHADTTPSAAQLLLQALTPPSSNPVSVSSTATAVSPAATSSTSALANTKATLIKTLYAEVQALEAQIAALEASSPTSFAFRTARNSTMATTLPPTAIGKDFPVDRRLIGLSTSRTGVRINLGGYVGFTLGWVEGVEINLLNAVA